MESLFGKVRNTFFYRAPPAAASVLNYYRLLISPQIYNLLRDQVRDESIIVWASEIKELAAIADPENTTLVEAEQYIQAYIDGIATADKDETAELTQKLIEGISNITTELTCLSYELALLQHSATQCSEGSDNITTLYDEMSASWASSVCTENDNIDFSKFLGYVETKMGNLGKTFLGLLS